MNESERLQQKAEEQYMQERMEELFAWLEKTHKIIDRKIDTARTNLRFMFLFVFLQIVTATLLNHLIWMLFFVAVLLLVVRHTYLMQSINRHVGQVWGAHKTLFILGVAHTDIEEEFNKRKKRKIRLRVSPFKRFKEFFERIKNKKTAHA